MRIQLVPPSIRLGSYLIVRKPRASVNMSLEMNLSVLEIPWSKIDGAYDIGFGRITVSVFALGQFAVVVFKCGNNRQEKTLACVVRQCLER
jgi:hypothetical protein